MSETATRTFPAASPAGAAICNALGVGVPARSADPEVSPSEKLVTIDQAAAMQFEPWEPIPDGWRPPEDDEWVPFGVWALPNVRIAWAVMFKTKRELETICQKLDSGAFGAMFDGVFEARKAFKDFLEVLEGAEARILCAAASVVLKDEREGHADV